MIQKLEKIMNAYLNKQLVKDAMLAGPGSENDGLVEEDSKLQEVIFVGRIESFLQFNKNLIMTVYAIIIAVVVFLGVLIWFQRGNLGFVLGLLGGQGAGIYFGITKMHQIYKENFVARMILNMVPNASGKEEKDRLLQMMKDFIEK